MKLAFKVQDINDIKIDLSEMFESGCGEFDTSPYEYCQCRGCTNYITPGGMELWANNECDVQSCMIQEIQDSNIIPNISKTEAKIILEFIDDIQILLREFDAYYIYDTESKELFVVNKHEYIEVDFK